MAETKSNFEYQVGGSLDGNAPSYVTRQADGDFYQALKAGQFCYVLNSRQMGKSSLRVRAMQRLQAEGTVCVFIDLTGMGKQDVTPEKWYAGIVQSLVSGCQLTAKIQWRTWWRERQDLLSPVQRLSLFIEEVLLVEVKSNIVIFVDEIDRILSQNFSLDDFLALIRYFYEQRDTHPDYKRLTFALLGVANPSDLIQDKTQTPFNIGTAIQMQGFQPLSRLVVERQGKLKVYNPIYEAVFNRNWLEKNLEQLRPYARAIAAWIASGSQDESCLLRGLELQDALTWSLGKSLSDRDYQFLVASQDLAKQQTEKLLEATEYASHLLASARSQAKREVLKRRLGWGWMPLVAIGVTIPILLLRFCGLLQGLEWNLLDQFFRWRPLEAPDPRIAIVTIDETDLTQVGQWPVSDRILAQAIAKIKAQNPQAIGLDLYRDLPVEPGHTDLVKLFQSTPNLFGIEKVVENKVAASPVLSQLGQVGFCDLVVDGDGKVRRALLSVILSDGEVRYSLAVKLALHYLQAEGIALEPLEKEGKRVRLGQAVFERFTGNDGGYVRTQSGGYPILLNFRGTQENFATFSLREVLENQIPPDSLRERLVFIGTTAESIHDLFYTPYSSRLFSSPEMMPGITLHANIASQILSAALEGRPLLRVWSDPIEWLGILAIALLGAGISWWLKSPTVIAISLLLASGGLLGGCYLAFVLGWWLPVVPSLLALLGAAVALSLVRNRQRDRVIFRRTLDLLREISQDYPTSGRIALLYLKQSETRENQGFIEQKLTP